MGIPSLCPLARVLITPSGLPLGSERCSLAAPSLAGAGCWGRQPLPGHLAANLVPSWLTPGPWWGWEEALPWMGPSPGPSAKQTATRMCGGSSLNSAMIDPHAPWHTCHVSSRGPLGMGQLGLSITMVGAESHIAPHTTHNHTDVHTHTHITTHE